MGLSTGMPESPRAGPSGAASPAAICCSTPGSCCLAGILASRPNPAPAPLCGDPGARRGRTSQNYQFRTSRRVARVKAPTARPGSTRDRSTTLCSRWLTGRDPQTVWRRYCAGRDAKVKWKVIAALAVALALAPAAPARAENPAVGSSCVGGQLNQTTVSTAGTTVRCLADQGRGYIWQADTGIQQTPADAERIARDACARLGHPTDECSGAVDQAPRQ